MKVKSPITNMVGPWCELELTSSPSANSQLGQSVQTRCRGDGDVRLKEALPCSLHEDTRRAVKQTLHADVHIQAPVTVSGGRR